MNAFINRLKLIFIGIFAVACAGIWTFQLMYARPEALCEGHGGWWDWHERTCAQPTPLYKITGRGGDARLVPMNKPVQP